MSLLFYGGTYDPPYPQPWDKWVPEPRPAIPPPPPRWPPDWTTSITVTGEPMQKSTDITVLIDESGSMDSRINDTLSGFNGFLREQKRIDAPCKLSLVTFATTHKVVYAAHELANVRELSKEHYRPSGGTALFDAMAYAIDAAAERGSRNPVDKVVFVVFTDGEENSSHMGLAALKSKVEDKQFRGWEFLFMGANIDAFTAAKQMGMPLAFAATVAPSKWNQSYNYMSNNLGLMRSGIMENSSFTSAQQKDLETN